MTPVSGFTVVSAPATVQFGTHLATSYLWTRLLVILQAAVIVIVLVFRPAEILTIPQAQSPQAREG